MPSEKQERQEKVKKKTARNQQILGSLRAGWSAKKVADEYGLSYSGAKKLCNRFLEGESGERKHSRRSVFDQRNNPGNVIP